MIKIFLLVVGCYVLAGFMVHAVYRLKRQRRRSAKHYVLLASRQHSNMERIIRSFFSFSRWMGVDVHLTVVDAGLSEQTREIIERLNRPAGGVHLYVDGFEESELTHPLAKQLERDRRFEGGLEQELSERVPQQQFKPDVNKPDTGASSLLWRLQADGVITKNDCPVVIDLHNPEDLGKIPF
ncbi:hypothetical protein [Paenibacillus sp. Leaf72]|uniref:hypothetical protein n=1 Tax=Paenibacillus sp. Leaf72 TaxID=1736234 RepID=UPI0006FF9EC3|nr:hypothetical protein [Paenibacillus sp. Leaf72]KQO10998.1 hypothetical protein ASF12_11540 [Paenibacillus sp. Leaf72]